LAAFEGHLEIVQYLAENRARLDQFDGDCLTPFMAACSGGHVEVARFLLQANSDPCKCSFWGFTALHIAVEDLSTEVCEWLLHEARGVVVNAMAQYDETILHIAGRVDHWEVIDFMQTPLGQALVDARTTTGFSALHLAAALGNLRATDSLLRLRAEIDSRTLHDATALYIATEGGHLDVVQFLLFMGANPSIPCNCFHVHHSSLDWHLPRDSINLLNVQVGGQVSFNLAELELPYDEKRPSRWVAGIVEAVEEDPDSPDRFDDLLMINTGEVTYSISRYNCMPHLRSTSLENQHVIQPGETVYVKAPIYCNAGDWILVPGDVGHVVTVHSTGEYEIEASWDSSKSRYLATREDLLPYLQEEALQCAARCGHGDIVDELLRARADVLAGPRTALQGAAQAGHLPIVKKLLEARADMDSPWLVSNSILETATWAQQEHIVSYLLQSKASLLSRRPLQMLAEAIAAARSAGASTQPLVQQLLKLMPEFTDPNEDAECSDLWLDRSCLLELRDLGMECLIKGDEASAVGLSEFLGRARCHEAAQRPQERVDQGRRPNKRWRRHSL